jgi:hypothetical protein
MWIAYLVWSLALRQSLLGDHFPVSALVSARVERTSETRNNVMSNMT